MSDPTSPKPGAAPPTDEERRCERCGATFWFRAGEQRFFSERGLPDPPRRCASCRKARKDAARRGPPVPARTASAHAAPQSAIPRCAWCGHEARVPFAVAAHRPVACEACYRWRLGVGSGLVED